MSCVGAHLLNAAIAGNFQLYYWRDGNDEIDFILARGKEVIALEVKSGASKRAAGLNAFNKKFPGARFLLIGDSGIPWDEFITLNPSELFSDTTHQFPVFSETG